MATLTQIDRCTPANNPVRNFGSPTALDNLGAQTIIVCFKISGAPQNNIGYLYSKCASDGTGLRSFIHYNGSGYSLRFGQDSTGDGGNGWPQRFSNVDQVGVSDGWCYYAITWDGTTSGAGIKLYKMPQATGSISELTYLQTDNGAGTILSDASYDAILWNRTGGNRANNGDGAWVAVLSGVLTSTEIKAACDNGPISDNRLVALFANGDEIANSGISQASSSGVTVVTDTAQFPANQNLGSSGVAVTPAVANVVVSALAPTVAAGGVAVTPAVATITVSAPAPSVSAGVSVNPSIAAVTVSTLAPVVSVGVSVNPGSASVAVTAPVPAVVVGGISLNGDYERASVIISGSSVSGAGDSAIISIKPQVQESQVVSSETRWLQWHVEITGVNGIRPTLRVLDYKSGDGGMHGYPWPSTRRAMFCYPDVDPNAWFYFDTVTIDSGNQRLDHRHNTAFTQNRIWFAQTRSILPTHWAQTIADWATAHPTKFIPSPAAVAYSPSANVSTWPAQSFIADEFNPQTTNKSTVTPYIPLYSVEISDGSLTSPHGVKPIILLTATPHAGEDQTLYIVKNFINFVLSADATAVALRTYFRFLLVTPTQGPGWWGGGWRGQWTQGSGGQDDPNRNYNTTGVIETVDKPKAVTIAAVNDRQVVGAIDFHAAYYTSGAGGTAEQFFVYPFATGGAANFSAAANSFGGQQISVLNEASNLGEIQYDHQTRFGIGNNHSYTFEVSDSTPVSDTQISDVGKNLARAWDKLRVDGYLSMPTGVSVTPAVASVAVSAPAPTISVGISANPAAAVVSAQALAPAISLGGANVFPALVTVGVQVAAPAVSVGVSVQPLAAAVGAQALAPVIEIGVAVQPATASVSVQALAPAVLVGGVAVYPALVAVSVSAPAPAVTASTAVNVTPAVCVVSVMALPVTVSLGGQWQAVNDIAEQWQSMIETPETWLDAV